MRGFGSQGEQRLALLALLLAEARLLVPGPLLLLDDVLSELDARRRADPRGRLWPGSPTIADHDDAPRALPAEPSQVVRVTPSRAVVEARLPDEQALSNTVRGELGRFGPSGGLGEILERWPAAVGEAIARQAWPARIARDGTLHVSTTDSVWAFELGQRAADIASRLGVEAVRFAPGPLAGAEDAPRFGAGTRTVRPKTGAKRPGSPPRSRIRACAKVSKER